MKRHDRQYNGYLGKILSVFLTFCITITLSGSSVVKGQPLFGYDKHSFKTIMSVPASYKAVGIETLEKNISDYTGMPVVITLTGNELNKGTEKLKITIDDKVTDTLKKSEKYYAFGQVNKKALFKSKYDFKVFSLVKAEGLTFELKDGSEYCKFGPIGEWGAPDASLYKNKSTDPALCDKHPDYSNIQFDYKVPSSINDKTHAMAYEANGTTVRQYVFFDDGSTDASKDEMLYLFYFNYDNYLKDHRSMWDDWDRWAVENLILKNILYDGNNINGVPDETRNKLDSNFELLGINIGINTYDKGIEKIKRYSGKNSSVDYFGTAYKIEPNNKDSTGEYKLEFVFVPNGDNGVACVLYVYPSGEGKYMELVNYLIDTIDLDL